MTKHAVAAAALALALLALLLAAPADAPRASDPAALRLLPPGALVTQLVTRAGDRLPVVAPRGTEGRGRGYRIDGEIVVYQAGPREKSVPLADLALDLAGEPVVERAFFALGTDGFGRDLAARLLAGARVSLGVALAGVLGAALLGAFVGVASGLARGVVASGLTLLTDSVLAIPKIALVMALAITVRPGAGSLALLLAITGWPAIARLVRAEAARAARSDVALAARALGATPWRIGFRHILPDTLATLLVAMGLRVGPFVLLEASLSFLGFGVAPPAASWGTILAEGREVLYDAWWVATLPGLALVATVVAVNRVVDRISA